MTGPPQDQTPGEAGHYFSTRPGSPEHRRRIEVQVWGRTLPLLTANGVFAADGLDRGTAVLLRTCRPPSTAPRRLLDLGCGYGVIGLALALACPGARVDAVDVNERALALTRDNAAALGVGDRLTALSPEQADPAARYDEIWSNPPIRVGKAALHDLLLRWLPRLAPAGVGRLVVSKDLGGDTLQRWLVEQGYGCVRTATDKGFRVLEVSPSAPTPPA